MVFKGILVLFLFRPYICVCVCVCVCCVAIKNEGITLSFHKNIYVFISHEKVQASVVWERQTETNGDRERRSQTAILTHNFLPALWDAAPAGCPATRWCSSWLTESLLAVSWDWLKTDPISQGHLYISFHNTHTFPFNHVTASIYLHRFVLCREISDWWLGQGTICNT